MFSNKEGEMFSQEGKIYSKEGDMPSESSHEGEVAKKGENQRGIMVLGGGQAIICQFLQKLCLL